MNRWHQTFYCDNGHSSVTTANSKNRFRFFFSIECQNGGCKVLACSIIVNPPYLPESLFIRTKSCKILPTSSKFLRFLFFFLLIVTDIQFFYCCNESLVGVSARKSQSEGKDLEKRESQKVRTKLITNKLYRERKQERVIWRNRNSRLALDF